MRTKPMLLLVAITILYLKLPYVLATINLNDGGTHDISTVITDFIVVENDPCGASTTVNVHNGAVIDGIIAYDDSIITVLDGEVEVLTTWENSQVTIEGGLVQHLYARNGGNATIFGGSVDYLATIYVDGHITIYGGLIGHINALENGEVIVFGTNFNYAYGAVSDMSGTLTGMLAYNQSINCGFQRQSYEGAEIGALILNPYENHTLTVQTLPTFVDTVTPSVGDHIFAGTVNINADRFSSCPDVYIFEHWEGDVVDPNAANTSLLMDIDKTVTAVFVATRECGDECHPDDLFGDYNHDCIIDFIDMAKFAENWLVCTKPECD